MILTISMLKNIFPLDTKVQNYHLSIPMCYFNYLNVHRFSLKQLRMLMNNILLEITRHDS